jgi:hypothetical protein
MIRAFLPALVLLAGCASSRTPSADLHGVWIDLFDGSTLTGWTVRGGSAWFRVEDGQIIGATAPNSPNTFLCTDATFRDFELALEFKVDPGLNSGVQIRSESRPEYQNGRVHGYQVEIDPSQRAWTGGIYDEGRRGWLADLAGNTPAREAFRQGEWNALRVAAEGDRIRTWINGVPAADLRDGMTGEGFIALQVHGVGARAEPMEVRFRSIRLRPATPEPGSQPSDGAPVPATRGG